MKLIVGNWKMNGVRADIAQLEMLLQTPAPPRADLLVCPPLTLVLAFVEKALKSHVKIGAQDCHSEQVAGAYTGDVSAQMLMDAGITHVIVGHSERRAGHGETDALVRAKAEAAVMAGLLPILCVGETLAERQGGQTLAVLHRQVRDSMPGCADAGRLVIAYEPVWAIGTGLTPTLAEVAEAHQAIAESAGAGYRVLYGGSVKPDNAAALMAVPGVDGVLVGGASLKAVDFLAIANAA